MEASIQQLANFIAQNGIVPVLCAVFIFVLVSVTRSEVSKILFLSIADWFRANAELTRLSKEALAEKRKRELETSISNIQESVKNETNVRTTNNSSRKRHGKMDR